MTEEQNKSKNKPLPLFFFCHWLPLAVLLYSGWHLIILITLILFCRVCSDSWENRGKIKLCWIRGSSTVWRCFPTQTSQVLDLGFSLGQRWKQTHWEYQGLCELPGFPSLCPLSCVPAGYKFQHILILGLPSHREFSSQRWKTPH